MKNLWVIPTDNPSRLWKNNLLQGKLELCKEVLPFSTAQHIYITSDEEIIGGKEWFLDLTDNSLFKNEVDEPMSKVLFPDCKKIIITTDQDLIKDGVQGINDEFLEWFVKDPSCDEVEVHELKLFNPDTNESGFCKWELDIPKEKPKQESCEYIKEVGCIKDICTCNTGPKQETLEQAAKEFLKNVNTKVHKDLERDGYLKIGFIAGAKWQAERMYSEEELRKAMNWMLTQYFEFHEWPAMGRVDHYVQSIKQQEQ